MTQNNGLIDHSISTDDLKDAMRDSQNLLDVPEHADVVGVEGEPGYKAVWNEVADVLKASYLPSKKGTGWQVAMVQFGIAADIEGDNAGRTLNLTWPIFPPAMTDRKHEYRGLTSGALKMLNNLAEAATGVTLADYGTIGAMCNEGSDIVGKRVGITISKYVKKNGDTEQSARAFSPVSS